MKEAVLSLNKQLKILFTNTAPLIKYGIKSGFDSLGHETYVMDDDYRIWHLPKEEQLAVFKKVIEEIKPDIVFSEVFVEFNEELFLYTKEKGIFHVFWSIEDTPHNHWIGDHWSNYADYIFTTTAECLPNYWNKGKKAEILLFACNPEFHKKVKSKQIYSADISLVGNNYPRRNHQTIEFLLPLLEKKYNINIYGNDCWLREDYEINLNKYRESYKGLLPYENIPSVYSSSKVALGFNLDESSVTQTSMRMTEILGCGGALMVSPYTKAQEFLFHDHVYLAKNRDELFLMVDEILSMTEQQHREKAQRAQDYVYKYHNYTLRAQQVVDAYHKW